MSYECRVYDKKGELIKVLSPKDISSQSDERIFNQKSTITAKARIKGFRELQPPVNPRRKFFNRVCLFCKKEFFPRHPYAKYCSHECQKLLYLQRKE